MVSEKMSETVPLAATSFKTSLTAKRCFSNVYFNIYRVDICFDRVFTDIYGVLCIVYSVLFIVLFVNSR